MKRKKLSLHVNRKIEASPLSAARADCPVVRTADAPEGLTEFRVRDSNGDRIAFFQIKASEMDDQLLDNIHDWQGRHSHTIPKVVKS